MAQLRLAFRTLFRSPFITLVAVASLALGIGANAAIFSLFDQILLRNLPVVAPHELVNLANPGPKPGSQTCNDQGGCDEVFSYSMFRDLEKAQQVFTGIAAHRAFGVNLSFRGQTINAEAMMVSGGYFPLLGIQPALGRLLSPEDDRTIGGHQVTVLSEQYWRTRFDSNPNVLNETLIVNGQALTIVGVAPRDFHGTSVGVRPYVYVPLTMRGLLQPGFVRGNASGFENRRTYFAYLFARLQPGVSIEQATTGINVPYAAILNDVEAALQQGMSEQTLERFKAKRITLAPGSQGQSSVQEEASTPLLLLMGVTGVVLLIACANIANLLLVRGAGRAGEMAVRLSIGATRRQLIVQLLLESLVLAVMGAAAGVMVSRWTLDSIASLLPADATGMLDLRVDGAVIWFSAVLAVATGFLFGLFPALHSTRPSLVAALREGGQKGAARGASRFRATLATVQIALSMALLVAAGLFVRSLVNVSRVELGISTENLITFAIAPDLNGYTPDRSRALFVRAEEALATLPGVTSVAASLVPLLGGSNWGNSVSVQGFPAGPDTNTDSNFNEVGPGYFRTVGIPLLAGREFTPSDALGAPKVTIVNEAFARKFNLGRDAVGKYISDSIGNDAKLDILIIGLARDAKYSEVKEPTPPIFFRPYRQDDRLGYIGFYVKTATDPQQLMPAVQSVMAKLDPNLPITELKTLEQQVRENVFLDRMITTMSAAFAVLATILAAVGLYGVLAYTVAQRTREFGVRMALGADAGTVRHMVLRQVAVMTGIGAIVGLAAAVALGQGAESLLFQMRGTDPLVFASATLLLALVALAAGFIPAQKASRIDPMIALRYE
jgi:predicted permease